MNMNLGDYIAILIDFRDILIVGLVFLIGFKIMIWVERQIERLREIWHK